MPWKAEPSLQRRMDKGPGLLVSPIHMASTFSHGQSPRQVGTPNGTNGGRRGGASPPGIRGLVERATRFELATFSLATAPGVLSRGASPVLRMALNGSLEPL